MKIIDKIRSYDNGKPFFSFEYFPPKTEPGLQNLYARLDRMAAWEPLFVDMTWGAGGSTCEQTMGLALNTQKYFGLDVMMHLTCTNMPADKITEALDACYSGGVMNILALRGDPPRGETQWRQTSSGFAYASDLVRHIRANYDQEFGIGVGAYPGGHLESPDLATDIGHLKTKVAAGADFIITQLFYCLEEYQDFVTRVRAAGIDCPIIPGIMPITNYDRFCKFVEFAGVKVPAHVAQELAKRRLDDDAVKNYGIDLATQMCEELAATGSPGLHFYTLNLESAVGEILKNLGYGGDVHSHRQLPWRPSTMPGRRSEDVRPIFWSNRPKSYMARTTSWDDFPNGRWGDSRSPSFGNLNEYYVIRQGLGLKAAKEDIREMYGEPRQPEDVFAVFAGFCQGKVRQLPWSEGTMREETLRISEPLVALNESGFLTINSQPRVNGAPSEDKAVGWGKAGGYVYQKAYVEFFVAPERLEKLLECLAGFPSISYQAVNHKGHMFTNVDDNQVNAVTWGVFPGSEILQPTVVDPMSFMIWKEEAFDLWLTDWADRYPAGNPAQAVLKGIYDNYYLVNIVDNDYINGDLFKVFAPLIARYRNQRRGAAAPAEMAVTSTASEF